MKVFYPEQRFYYDWCGYVVMWWSGDVVIDDVLIRRNGDVVMFWFGDVVMLWCSDVFMWWKDDVVIWWLNCEHLYVLYSRLGKPYGKIWPFNLAIL